MLLPLVMYPVAMGSEKRYPQYAISCVTLGGKVTTRNRK